MRVFQRACVCVSVCVCARARARAWVCVSMCVGGEWEGQGGGKNLQTEVVNNTQLMSHEE